MYTGFAELGSRESQRLIVPPRHELTVCFGQLAFRLLHNNSRENPGIGIIEANPERLEELAGFGPTPTRFISPQPVPLLPGDIVRIGRGRGRHLLEHSLEITEPGIVICSADGVIDQERTEHLADRVVQHAAWHDRTLSREHASLHVGNDCTVTLRDADSKNGTRYALQLQPPVTVIDGTATPAPVTCES